jgi:hypothetical protein
MGLYAIIAFLAVSLAAMLWRLCLRGMALKWSLLMTVLDMGCTKELSS